MIILYVTKPFCVTLTHFLNAFIYFQNEALGEEADALSYFKDPSGMKGFGIRHPL